MLLLCEFVKDSAREYQISFSIAHLDINGKLSDRLLFQSTSKILDIAVLQFIREIKEFNAYDYRGFSVLRRSSWSDHYGSQAGICLLHVEKRGVA